MYVKNETHWASRWGRAGWRWSGLSGVAMVLALVGLSGRASAGPPNCPDGDVCVYADAQGFIENGGEHLDFDKCGTVDLSKLPFKGGGTWSDKVSAIYNNRLPVADARVYDYSGSGNDYIYLKTVESGDYLLDLSQDMANDEGPMNDRIDAIEIVCGGPLTHLTPDQLR
ncbi:peptidase inhibitor family I36 protein [Archangium gephyra]|uniref:peptidase inhibitor family I36 protein n=1 Tax=Archangium gephyra TaxID=48 RepID=UPI0035D3DBA3